ncbi:DUF6364 family protein [Saccharopolyspora sp. ASAGF58]|uniref:DUF6364 family protein n=1 Tax=Saccharopolyspora sp. ASAGF58 TaxID=2719023 RepID=UPI00143FE99C|nr:DUF6364 family protein [Saccharopolyspora sp. ASAGF58]QIZ34303.1 hypothetical protein FDZ84_05565 [Saccharopolyspora sp. ASAGF58]
MAKRNVTIQLDEEIIHQAKVLAAEEGTSVSGLLTVQLKELTAAKLRYREAKRAALEALSQAEDRGGITWTREELYDR